MVYDKILYKKKIGFETISNFHKEHRHEIYTINNYALIKQNEIENK